MMDEFYERQIQIANNKGEQTDADEAESAVVMGQGQTPTIDASVYNPKELRDNGYPLSNPTAQPNRYTKPNARVFAGRDSSNSQPVVPVTKMPVVESPNSNRYSTNMAPIYQGLESAQNAFTVETGLAKSFEQMIKYTNSLADEDPDVAGEEANRVKWATSDKLEQIGFNHVFESERTDEGIDDKGLDGLQMMMASQMMRGAINFEEVTEAIGDTGANPEQLEETWNKAQDAYARAAEGVVQNLPSSPETAIADPRYLGASAILNDALGYDLAKGMSEEKLRDQGMFLIDMVKGNPLVLAKAVIAAKDNPQVADAINFLMAADDEMPTTWGDFGRGVLGAAFDPTSYIGAGLAAKVVRGTVVKQAMKVAGLAGAEAGLLGGSYMGLMDYGFQNVDILSGRQEEFDLSRSAGQVGIGATAGFLLGGAISGLTAGGKALLTRMKPIPDNVVPESEMMLRRDVKKLETKLAADKITPEEFVNDINYMVDTDELIKSVERSVGIDHAELERLSKNLRKSTAALGEPLPPRVIKETDDKWTAELKRTLNHVDAGDFRFKINDTITVKTSGKEFKIHHVKWNDKTDLPEYFVKGPDGKRFYIPESDVVGGDPNLKLVSAADEFAEHDFNEFGDK